MSLVCYQHPRKNTVRSGNGNYHKKTRLSDKIRTTILVDLHLCIKIENAELCPPRPGPGLGVSAWTLNPKPGFRVQGLGYTPGRAKKRQSARSANQPPMNRVHVCFCINPKPQTPHQHVKSIMQSHPASLWYSDAAMPVSSFHNWTYINFANFHYKISQTESARRSRRLSTGLLEVSPDLMFSWQAAIARSTSIGKKIGNFFPCNITLEKNREFFPDFFSTFQHFSRFFPIFSKFSALFHIFSSVFKFFSQNFGIFSISVLRKCVRKQKIWKFSKNIWNFAKFCEKSRFFMKIENLCSFLGFCGFGSVSIR